MNVSPAVAVSLVSLAAVFGSLAVIYVRMLPAASWSSTLLLSVASAAIGALSWLVLAPVIAPGMLSALYLSITGLAALATFLATLTVRSTGASPLVVLLFALLWGVIVFVPVALMSLAGLGPVALEPIDHGGSLAVNVAGGAAALGVLLAAGSGSPRAKARVLPFPLGVVAALVLSAAWLGWLAGAELAIDDVTPSIVINGLVSAVGGIAGWLAVQRILHQSTTLPALAAGLLSGLVSVSAGANLFTPVSAAAAGVISGAAACYFTMRRVGATRRQQWFIVGSHLMAGGLGVILLGLLATDMGFLFTGQIGFIQEQIASTVVVALYSTAVSFLVWMALKRVRSRP